MSIQEKKSAKGTPFAIVKFSDNNGEFELFLFSEILIKNREKIKESESFVLTLQKDNVNLDKSQKRINLKKISSLEDMINKPYSKVTIELSEKCNFNELRQLLSNKGNTEISFLVSNNNKQIQYNLQNSRKFDYNQLKLLKSKEYVKKIIV